MKKKNKANTMDITLGQSVKGMLLAGAFVGCVVGSMALGAHYDYVHHVEPARTALAAIGHDELAPYAILMPVDGAEAIGSEDGQLIRAINGSGETDFYFIRDEELFEVSGIEKQTICGVFSPQLSCTIRYILSEDAEINSLE